MLLHGGAGLKLRFLRVPHGFARVDGGEGWGLLCLMRFTRILFAVALILSAGPASGWAAGVGGMAAHVEGEVFR